MKKFKPLYTFASLWKQFVLFTKNWRRKPTGELVNKDTLELGDVTANDIEVRDIKCRKVTASGKIKTTSTMECAGITAPVINDEENPSVKPLYFHPIRMDIVGSIGTDTFRVKQGSIMIINNTNTPINNFTALKEFMRDNEVDILCNIDYYSDLGVYAGQVLGLYYVPEYPDNVRIMYTKDGLTADTGLLSSYEIINMSDTPNKIN